MLGIADRSGDGYKLTVVLGGLVVNGKKFDPQTGADLIADMLAEWMAKIAPPPAAAPETAVQDPEVAGHGASPDVASGAPIAESGDPDRPATNGDAAGEDLPALETAMTPGTNGHH
jgi:hypothetical protein